MNTTDRIFALLRAYVEAIDARRYSHAQRALTLLAEEGRRLPSWMEPAPLEPAAEVFRQLLCGASLTLRNEDGAVVLVVRDEETCTAVAMTADEAKQMRGDAARVMAAASDGKTEAA